MVDETESEFLIESNAIEGVKDLQSYRDACKAWEFLREQPVMSKVATAYKNPTISTEIS